MTQILMPKTQLGILHYNSRKIQIFIIYYLKKVQVLPVPRVANIKESLENPENPETPETLRDLENPESIAANFSYCFIFIMYNIILHYIMSFILDNKKIDLNIMTDNSIISSTTEMNFTKLAKPEILAKCKELGFTNYKSKNKKALIELINSKKLFENP